MAETKAKPKKKSFKEKVGKDLRRRFEKELQCFESYRDFFAKLSEELSEGDVAKVVSRWTGIPISKMLTQEKDKLIRMEEILEQRVVGQRGSIDAISNAVRKSRAGLKKANRPIGNFFFFGPTGTGKTELAKALAEFLFDDEKNIIRFDMSEYQESHSVAKLTGAPPGYVGYEEGGALTDAVRRRPYSVLLFDEIEKAHSNVFNIFLQMMDEGRLTDSQRRTVDFSDCLIIFTSNEGAELILEKDQNNEEIEKDEVVGILLKRFKPEFLNRLTDTAIFHTLSLEQIQKIVDLQFKETQKYLDEQGIRVILDKEAKTKLATDGYSFEMGARPVQRLIDQKILNPLSIDLISGDYKAGDTITVKIKDGEYVFEKS